jgi:hypothetical protein
MHPFSTLHWVAKCKPPEDWIKRIEDQPPDALTGFMDIAADANQAIPYKAIVRPDNKFQLRELKRTDLTEDGHFILRGKASLSLSADTHYGFGLYAMADGFNVIWAAISQSI